MNPEISIFGTLLVYVWHTVIFSRLIEPRFGKAKSVVILALTMAALFCFGCALLPFLGVSDTLFPLSLTTGIVIVIAVIFLSTDCLPKKIFITLTFYNANHIILQLSYVIAGIFFEQNTVPCQILSIIIRNILYAVAVPLYFKYVHPKFREVKVERNSEWWILSVISLMFAAIYMVQETAVGPFWTLTSGNAAVLFLIFIQGIATFLVIFRIILYMNKSAEANMMEQNTKFLTGQIDRLMRNENRVRQLRHDMRHNLMNIAMHIQNGDNNAALEYLKKCATELSGTEIRRFCANVTLNNIISAYSDRAEREGILLSCKAKAAADLPIKETDLVAVLANLLENAINACVNISEPKIEIFISDDEKRLVIIVNNTCGDLELTGKYPKNKGIGISSVISAVEKYNGSIDYTVENGICSACAAISLPDKAAASDALQTGS